MFFLGVYAEQGFFFKLSGIPPKRAQGGTGWLHGAGAQSERREAELLSKVKATDAF